MIKLKCILFFYFVRLCVLGGLAAAPVVCDNGTGYVKVGFAPSNFPLYTFPSMLGRPLMRFEEKCSEVEIKELMIGDECAANRHMLDVTYPIENGQVKNWADMDSLWRYTFFEKLCVDPSDHKVAFFFFSSF